MPRIEPPDEAHKALERTGRDAVAHWIAHPAVREILMRSAPAIVPMIAPIAGYLTDLEAVTIFSAWAMGVVPQYADGIHWPGPCVAWALQTDQVPSLEAAALELRRALEQLVTALVEAGVDLDIGSRQTSLVVAQLVVSEALESFDLSFDWWSLPPDEIVEGLNIPALGGYSDDGYDTRTSRFHGVTDDERLSRLARAQRESRGATTVRLHAGGQPEAALDPEAIARAYWRRVDRTGKLPSQEALAEDFYRQPRQFKEHLRRLKADGRLTWPPHQPDAAGE